MMSNREEVSLDLVQVAYVAPRVWRGSVRGDAAELHSEAAVFWSSQLGCWSYRCPVCGLQAEGYVTAGGASYGLLSHRQYGGCASAPLL